MIDTLPTNRLRKNYFLAPSFHWFDWSIRFCNPAADTKLPHHHCIITPLTTMSRSIWGIVIGKASKSNMYLKTPSSYHSYYYYHFYYYYYYYYDVLLRAAAAEPGLFTAFYSNVKLPIPIRDLQTNISLKDFSAISFIRRRVLLVKNTASNNSRKFTSLNVRTCLLLMRRKM